jgi:RNA polymerase sigma-70 factor (ECF subfamily)
VAVHLDAAYNLARWLTRDDQEAQDVVQDACLRAFRFLDGYRGGNDRAWLLAIVRNAYYSRLKKNRAQSLNVPLDEEGSLADGATSPGWDGGDVDEVMRSLEREDARRTVDQALAQLPLEYREVIVLRELEEMSYQEIATVVQIPIGTVMSRLSRGRKLLLQVLRQTGQGT